jgi:hypothetical protein
MEDRDYGDRGRDGEGNRIGTIVVSLWGAGVRVGGVTGGGKGPKETRLDGVDLARLG